MVAAAVRFSPGDHIRAAAVSPCRCVLLGDSKVWWGTRCGLSACTLLPSTQHSQHDTARHCLSRCRPKQCHSQRGLVSSQRRFPDHTQELLVGARLKPDQELFNQQSRCQGLVLPTRHCPVHQAQLVLTPSFSPKAERVQGITSSGLPKCQPRNASVPRNPLGRGYKRRGDVVGQTQRIFLWGRAILFDLPSSEMPSCFPSHCLRGLLRTCSVCFGGGRALPTKLLFFPPDCFFPHRPVSRKPGGRLAACWLSRGLGEGRRAGS